MKRVTEVFDCWFESGSMPYAQLHYPFENKDRFESTFPADFIAEGLDQTRGWFFTLHAIGTMCFDSVAFKNVVSNGLVLDKNGNKMSKRLGNAADPFDTLSNFGPDATRWYMIGNAQPWDNLKFNEEGIKEVQRRFFGTLYNTYAFFALYANIDGFDAIQAKPLPIDQRPELDRWILSKLNTLILEVTEEGAVFVQYHPDRRTCPRWPYHVEQPEAMRGRPLRHPRADPEEHCLADHPEHLVLYSGSVSDKERVELDVLTEVSYPWHASRSRARPPSRTLSETRYAA
jgi:hypothetical protein